MELSPGAGLGGAGRGGAGRIRTTNHARGTVEARNAPEINTRYLVLIV